VTKQKQWTYGVDKDAFVACALPMSLGECETKVCKIKSYLYICNNKTTEDEFVEFCTELFLLFLF
jgi:hypothetical protein